MDFDLRTPCKDCPFRNDIKPYLRPERYQQILESPGLFPCHKTVKHGETDDEDEEYSPTSEGQKVCAGFLILLEKSGVPNQMMRICERIGDYNYNKLNMEAPVYDSVDELYETVGVYDDVEPEYDDVEYEEDSDEEVDYE